MVGSTEPIELGLEFEGFLNRGLLQIEDIQREVFTVSLTSSPLILNHHLQPAVEVMAMEYPSRTSTTPK